MSKRSHVILAVSVMFTTASRDQRHRRALLGHPGIAACAVALSGTPMVL